MKQRPERVGHVHPDPLGGVGLGPMPVVAAVAAEPADPRGDVDDDSGAADRHERIDPLEERTEPGLARAYADNAAQAHVPHDGHQPERDHEPDARPLRRARKAEHEAGGPAPRASPRARACAGSQGGHGRDVGREGQDALGDASSGAVAVEQDRSECGKDEEHQRAIEQCGARHRDGHAVDREEESGHSTQERRARQPPPDPHREEHRERAEQCGHEAPAERREPEQVFAEGDRPLADRWVDDEGRTARPEHIDRAPVAIAGQDDVVGLLDRGVLVTEAQVGQCVLHVVGLVEDHRVRSGEVGESQDACDDRDAQSHEPSDQPVVGHRGVQLRRQWTRTALCAAQGGRPLREGRRHGVSIGSRPCVADVAG